MDPLFDMFLSALYRRKEHKFLDMYLGSSNRALAMRPVVCGCGAPDGAPLSTPPQVGRTRWQRHMDYFRINMETLPAAYSGMSSNRMTLLYFCVSGLDLLDALTPEESTRIAEWVYSP